MLKLDYILSPLNNKGSMVKNLLQIDYENNVLTTPEWKENNIKSDLKINYIPIPKKCYQMRNKLLEIIKIYETGKKILENSKVRIFLDYPCKTSEVDTLIQKNLLDLLKGK